MDDKDQKNRSQGGQGQGDRGAQGADESDGTRVADNPGGRSDDGKAPYDGKEKESQSEA